MLFKNGNVERTKVGAAVQVPAHGFLDSNI